MPLHIQLIMYSPIIGLAIATFLYVRYRRPARTGKPLSAFVYFPIVAIAGFAGFHGGKFSGILIACVVPEEPGNLCGLFGYFVTGPAACTLVMILTGFFLIRYARRRAQSTEPA